MTDGYEIDEHTEEDMRSAQMAKWGMTDKHRFWVYKRTDAETRQLIATCISREQAKRCINKHRRDVTLPDK